MNATLILELVYATLMYAPSAAATDHEHNLLQIKVNEDYIFSLTLLSTHFVSGQKMTHTIKHVCCPLTAITPQQHILFIMQYRKQTHAQ